MRHLQSVILVLALTSMAKPEAASAQQSGVTTQSTTGSSSAPASTNTKPAASSKSKAALLTITGIVSDTKGDRQIADAHIVLSKVGQSHKRWETTSNKDGDFSFENIEPGSYSLTVSAKDMLAHSQHILLKPGESRTVTINLEDMEKLDTLRVSGKRTLIHPDKIGNETNLDHKFIYQYKTGNDLKELINSTPGIMNDSFGNVITRGEHNSLNYEIDGVVIPEAAGVLQQSQVISPRSLQSMQVDIGGYEAQDGGGPLGAVVHMKSLPILAKPNLSIGHQLGGPIAEVITYNGSTAFSQNPGSIWNKVRVESSGAFRGTSYRLAPPVKNYVNNNAFDVNSFTKLEFRPTERDVFRISAAINETFAQIPTSQGTRAAGFHGKQHDAQDYVIASYIHKFEKFFDELNLHFLNGIYYEKFRTSMAFDPYPNFNNGQALQSMAVNANRFNYIFSAQGALTKTVKKSHHFKVGFLSELRPIRTNFNAVYYNADLVSSLQQQAAASGISDATQLGIATANNIGDSDTANALLATLPINTNPFPYGALISPYTGQLGGPQFWGPQGRFHGLRYLQSAYFQDKYTPLHPFWKRLTLDAGVRFDLQKTYYGNALPLYQTMGSIPGVVPFSIQPFMAQVKADAQASGRYGATFTLTKNTLLRGSYSDLFMPNASDYFLTPPQVTNISPTNGVYAYGVYDGTPRPLHATRGQLVDTGIERQIGPRFSTRVNGFYKYLTNFGDSGVVGNLPLYNRLTNSAQDAYGVETRMDLKSAKDGYGFNGFLSNTVQVAYLRQSKNVTGGFYTPQNAISLKFPDHDRRMSSVAGVGYKTRQNLWALLSVQVLTGLQDERDPNLSGPHRARTPVQDLLSLSMGWTPSKEVQKRLATWHLPNSFDLRIENLLNQRLPVNLGSPFQGTRYNLPIRVLAGCNWQFGPEEAKLSAKPSPSSIRTLAPQAQI